MSQIIHQCLPEVLSFLKEVAVGYVLYRIGKNENTLPNAPHSQAAKKYVFRNPH